MNKNSILLHPGSGDFSDNVMVYLEASKILITHSKKEPMTSKFIYPALFCFRHSIELSLKSILWFLVENYLESDRKDEMKKIITGVKGHSLDVLAREMHSLIDEFQEACGQLSQKATEIIRQIHNLDPTGITFRYNLDKEGNPIITELIEIDTVKLKKDMEEVINEILNKYVDIFESKEVDDYFLSLYAKEYH